jgi:aspartyl-tRNA(Asn)/glutamyl-tRNA(Gln) amidotransferase subunit A
VREAVDPEQTMSDDIDPRALPWLTMDRAAAALRSGACTSRALTEAMLARIEAHDGVLNAFMIVTAERALDAADVADAELSRGVDRGPLHGIPVAVKDLFDTAGIVTTAGTQMWAQRVPETDATAVKRLAAAGAVSLGKTGMHELAWGSTSANPHFGAIHNPWKTDHHPGGSSGGSAAAVAAGLAFAALGTDTGCSVRQPAHCCGIVGYKPTFGLVSKAGVVPLAWSLDHVGVLTRSVADAAHTAMALMGPDPADPWCIDRAPPDVTHALGQPVEGGVIGVPRGWFFDDVEPGIAALVEAALDTYRSLGVQIVDVELTGMPEVWDAARTTFAEVDAAHGETTRAHPEAFSEEIHHRMEGVACKTAAEYAAAQQVRVVFRRRVRVAMEGVDVLALPTSMLLAEPLDKQSPARAVDRARNTVPFNFTGQPAISVPCGFSPDGLPAGLMLVGRRFEDARVLQYAEGYERATPWTGQHPPAFA